MEERRVRRALPGRAAGARAVGQGRGPAAAELCYRKLRPTACARRLQSCLDRLSVCFLISLNRKSCSSGRQNLPDVFSRKSQHLTQLDVSQITGHKKKCFFE